MQEEQILERIQEAIGKQQEAQDNLDKASKEAERMRLIWRTAVENKNLIKNELSTLAPFKAGDKVKVRNGKNAGTLFKPKWVDATGYISKILVHLSHKDLKYEFEYRVSGVKKNGEASKIRLSFAKRKHDASDLTKID